MRKIINIENGTIEITGNNHDIAIEYDKPDWSEDEEPCFMYHDHKYFLSEFPRTKNNPWGNASEWAQKYDAMMADSYFSGLLINLTNGGDSVRVYYFVARS